MTRFMTGPAVVAVCFTVLVTTTPAQATYPGKNGRIAFRLSSTSINIGERSSRSDPMALVSAR